MKQRYPSKSNALKRKLWIFVLLAFLALAGGMDAVAQTNWTPPAAGGTFRLRSTGTGNNFNVYNAAGTAFISGGNNKSKIYSRVNLTGELTLLFENTNTIELDGQFDLQNPGAKLTMKFGDGVPFNQIAHSSDNPTLKIKGSTGSSGTHIFYLRPNGSADVTRQQVFIEGNDPTGTESYPTSYDFSNNFVIDGDGPTLTAVDDSVTMTPQVTATGGAIKSYNLFRLQQGTLHLKNVTVQNFSTSYDFSGMAQVNTNNATCAVDLEFNHCLFTSIGAKSDAGSPVLRMQGSGGNNENRDARLKYCKFENIFGSKTLAVGSTTYTNNANATVRTVGNNQTKLSIDGCHFTRNYGCPVRWHGCASAEPMRVNNCLIEDSFTWKDDSQVYGGGGMLLKGPATITNCTIRNNRTNGKGGGIYLSTYVDFNGGTVGLIPQHTILNLDPATVISDNVAQEDGGGVAIEAKLMRIPNSQWYGNTYLTNTNGVIYWTANQDGSANEDDPFRTEFKQNGATIINNTANGTYGGGVYISRDPNTPFYKVDCIINYGKIIGNKTGGNGLSGKGGGVAIRTYKDDDVIFTHPLPTSTEVPVVKPQDVTVVVSGPELDPDNAADEMLVYNNKSGDGGGVYVEAYPNVFGVGQYPLTDSTVSKVSTTVYATGNINTNTATNDGGGLYVKYGNVDILGGTIGGETQAAGNTAGRDGGGIYLEEGLITAEYAVIQSNTAGHNGGGINNDKGNILIKGSTIGGGEGKGNTATSGSGGGIFAQEGHIFIHYWDPAGNTINDTNYVIQDATRPTEITYNTAGRNGGGINTQQGKIFAVGRDYDSKIKISNNKASDGSGGGVFCMGEENAEKEYIRLENAEINNNSALTLKDIEKETVVDNVIIGCGGGIYLQHGIINLKASTVNENTAKWNGGGINNHSGNIKVLGSEVCRDTAYHSGGGIYTNFGDIDIEDYAESSTNSVTLRHSKINDNYAEINGGGIDTHQGIITINKDEDSDQIEITGNKAGVNGGGIYADQGTIYAYNARVENNTAGNNGGGANNHSGDIYFYGGSVSNNSAKNGHGGGIYTNVGDIHLLPFPSDTPIDEITAFNGTYLYNNIAKYNGGGINNHTGRVNVRYATLRNNTATLGNGGGIFCEGPHASSTGYTIRLLNSYLKENKTRGANGTVADPTGRGGGIYLKYGSILAQGSNIVDNSANINGGGLDNHSGNIRVYGCQLIGNKAVTGHGGGIYTQEGDIITGPSGLSGRTLIQKNTAGQNGGGINNHEGKITINGDYIGHPGDKDDNTEYRKLGNIALTGHGGGVFVRNGSIEMFGGAISNNQAKLTNNVGGNGGGVNIGGEAGEGGEGGTFTIKKRIAKPIVDIIDVELGRDTVNAGKYTATIHYHVIDNLNKEYYTDPAFGFTNEAINDQLIWVSTNQGAATVAPSSVIGDLPGCRRLTISNLEPTTDYKVKVSVTNKQSPAGYPKTGYSDECEFTTFSSSPTVLTGAVSNITNTTASANGKVVDNGVGPTKDDPNGIAVEARGIIYSTNAPSDHPLEVGQDGVVLVPEFPIKTDDYFTLNLTGLTASTTYYVRAFAYNNRRYGYGEVEEFTTLQTLPNMGTGKVTATLLSTQPDGTYTYKFTFTVRNTATFNSLRDYGFLLSTDDDPDMVPENVVPAALSPGSTRKFEGTMSGLSPNTTYYVRAFGSTTTTEHDPAHISEYALTTPTEFTTRNGNLPVLRLVRISDITQDSAKITLKIVYRPTTLKNYGICFSSSNQSPTVNNNGDCYIVRKRETLNLVVNREYTITIPRDASSNPSSLSNPLLDPSTTYYLRAFAWNGNSTAIPSDEDKIAYSNGFNFTTLPLTPPHVKAEVTDIQATEASVVCTVTWGGQTFDPSNPAFTYGIYYRKVNLEDPNDYNAPYNYIQVPGSGLTAENDSVFTVNLSGLTPETQYQVYAYASNTIGTTDTHSYPVSFFTIYDPPTFNTDNLVITPTDGSITIEGITVKAGNYYRITKYGICFSEVPHPTLESESVDHVCGHSETIGTIAINDTQTIPNATFGAPDYILVPNKQYYITAYAQSDQAVHTPNIYSDQKPCITLPLVSTGERQNATTTTVDLTGSIDSSDPNHYIAECGVCYSEINANPTIDDVHKSVAVTAPNPDTTHFTITLNVAEDGISSGQSYYWRAYAKNTEGRYVYANEVKSEPLLSDGQITATTDPDGIGSDSISNNGYFFIGDDVTLTATPSESFLNWTKASDAIWSSTENPLTISNVDAPEQYVAHFNQNYQYTITANPGTGGTVTGGGSYNYGANCTLTATPESEDYRFRSWTKGTDTVSKVNPYEFSVTESGTYTANFDQRFTINATANTSNGGTVTGGGLFYNGTSDTLRATVNEGYRFVNWTKDGNQVSTEMTYVFKVTEDASYVANFVQVWIIEAIVAPDYSGTVRGAGTFDNGTSDTLRATPNKGYNFVNWTKDSDASWSSPDTLLIISDINASDLYVANFENEKYYIYVATATGDNTQGRVTMSGGTGTSNEFHYDQICSMVALPANNYRFEQWVKVDENEEIVDTVSTSPIYNFYVRESGSYKGSFKRVYLVSATADPAAGGTITSNRIGDTIHHPGIYHYDEGDNVALTAARNPGYSFVNWTENGSVVSTYTIDTIPDLAAPHTLVANFGYINYTITATTATGDNIQGTATVSDVYGNAQNVFNVGQTCILSATAEEGYRFLRWTKDGNQVSTEATYQFELNTGYVSTIVDPNVQYVAHFMEVYSVSATADPTEGGTIEGTGVYDEGDDVTLTATPNTGYTFVNWTTENGDIVSTDEEYTITELDANHTLVAHFQINSYTITATANPSNGGTVTGGDTYNHGASCTLTATPADGYHFANWTKNGVVVFYGSSYTFTVTEGGDYVANFDVDNSGGGGGKSTPNRPREIYPSFGNNPLFMEMSPLEQALWSSVADDTTRVAPKTREGEVPLKPEADTVGCLVTYPEINFNDAMANGGGIYVNINNAKVIFSDGQIDHNHATESGGGVFIGDKAEMTMINMCEVKHNHVDASDLAAHKGGGGIYQNGVLYVGDGTDAIHYLQVTDNWAGGNEHVYDPSVPNENNRNNVYLPIKPDPLPSLESWEDLNGETDPNYKMKRVITLLSDISKKDPATDRYYTNIGLTVDHGFRAVIYTKLIGPADTTANSAETHERWLTDLIPASGVLTNAAFFDDANKYYALHVHNTVNPDTLRRQCDYLYGCWTTEVTSNPGDDHIKLEGDVYHIKTNRGLAWFTSIVNGLNGQEPKPNAKAIVENNIDMREHLWVPIGSSLPAFYLKVQEGEEPVRKTKYGAEIVFKDGGAFVGEFNGQGHVITGLRCRYVTGIEKYGLFGRVTEKYKYNMVVNNDDDPTQSQQYDTTFIGAGKVMNTFVDDHVYWAFKKDDNLDIIPYRVGGIAGEAMHGAKIICSESRGQMIVQASECIPENTYIGGLVGKAVGDNITENEIPIQAKPVVIHSSMAMPEIVGAPDYIGGLVGYLDPNSSLYNSFANPKFPEKIKIIDTEYNVNYPMAEGKFIGGLVGENKGTVENCYTRLQGNVPQNDTPESVFGWLVGTSNNSKIKYCYAPEGVVTTPTEPNDSVYIRTGISPSNHGTYSKTERYSGKYGFKHRDHKITSAKIGENNYETLLVTDIDATGFTNQPFGNNAPGTSGNDGNGNTQQTLSTLSGGLITILDAWVDKPENANKGYTHWTRTMASPINDDYPIPMLAVMNESENKLFNSVGSKDTIYMLYEDDINDMWEPDVVSGGFITKPGKNFAACDTLGSKAAMYLYDVQPITTPASGTTPAVYATVDITGNNNVPLYIHEDVGITQPDKDVDDNIPALTARAGVTIRNARADESNPNWHLFSSAIQEVPLGIQYNTKDDGSYINKIVKPASQYYAHEHGTWIDRTQWDPPRTSWLGANSTALFNYNANTSANNNVGYFPTNTPYGTWRYEPYTHENNKNNNGDVGFFDLYEYNEYYYHWINYKREGTDAIQDHWHWDQDFEDKKHYRIGYNQGGDERYFNDVTMPAGKGYLMALSSESMMMADGILNTGTISVDVTNTPIGWNLPPNGHGSNNYTVDWRKLNMIGNPYQSYLDFDKFVEVNGTEGTNRLALDDYAVADDSQGPEVEYRYIYYTAGQSDNPFYSASRYIHPHQGFFVKVSSTGKLEFTDDMRVAGKIIINNVNNDDNNNVNSPYRGDRNYPLVNLLCFDEDGKRDLTTVEVNRPEFGGGHKMEKLHESKGLIYAHLQNESFQTLFTPVGINVVPVRFVPSEDGVFTLNWNTRHGEFSYLHLIDNMTGVDVDCLTNSEYRFESKTTDYRSRFKLVFRCEGDEDPDEPDEPEGGDDDDHFAFFFEDELIVNGEGLLQVFDIQGRCLLETQAIGPQSRHRLPRVAAGVYLLRLAGDKKVKIQKMVI